MYVTRGREPRTAGRVAAEKRKKEMRACGIGEDAALRTARPRSACSAPYDAPSLEIRPVRANSLAFTPYSIFTSRQVVQLVEGEELGIG